MTVGNKHLKFWRIYEVRDGQRVVLREEVKEKGGWILPGKSAKLSEKFIDREFVDVSSFGIKSN